MPDRERKSHFGLLSFTGTGHLTSFLALARELNRLGHRTTSLKSPRSKDAFARQDGRNSAGLRPAGYGQPVNLAARR